MRQDKPQETGTKREKRLMRAARRSRLGLQGMKVGRVVLFLLFAAAAYAILTAGSAPLKVEVGEPSPRDFRARVSFVRTNLERTRAAQDQARLAEPPVFRLTEEEWNEGVSNLLKGVREGPKSMLWQALPADFDAAGLAKAMPALREWVEQIEQALEDLSQHHLVSREDLDQPLVRDKQTSNVVLLKPSGEEEIMPRSGLVALDGEAAEFREAFGDVVKGLQPAQAALVRQGFALVLRPNVVLDVERSHQAAQLAAEQRPPITEPVKVGFPILVKGTRTRSQHVHDLQSELDQYRSSHMGRVARIQQFVGLGVLLLIILAGATAYARRYRPDLLASRPQTLSFVVLTLALVAAARICVVKGLSPLWVPLPLMVMTMCLVYDQRFGAVVAVFYALLVRLASPGADFEFFVLFVGGVIAALVTGKVRTRGTLIKAGIATGLAQFCCVWGLGLMWSINGEMVPLQFWRSPLVERSLVALANGVLCGFVVSGILPAIERLFGITTDIRLLEWSDPNQPLLQRMLLDAPGSYHHSMVVGSLAADAAEAVGANPLLARVSAYFHDVGKLKKPEYFAENLPAGARNPHDELSPTMSSLIITAHPKDGAEMAENYGVPREVRDIILQSHGSSVVKYFWGKAKSEEDERDEMQERTFRYRLPKPRSKEAAIVMLCDAVESAARSLDAPSVSQLRNLVHDIILDRLHDGQLDESGLTITDLKQLEDTLVRGLTAVFHSRVSYPDQEKTERKEKGRERVAARAAKPSDRGGRDAGGSGH